MEDKVTITDNVSTKMKESKDLFDRMDSDFKRWALKKGGLPGSFEYLTKVAQTRDTDITIRSNAPRTFSDGVQAILSSSERQISVRMAETEGEDKREDIGKLERLLEFAFEKADERLIRLLLPPFKDASVWYSLIRGWLAARILVYGDGKDVIFDFLPLDRRWLTYQVGTNGLLWSGYTTSHSPEALEDEYGKVIHKSPWYKPWTKSEKSYDVIDYWKNEGNGKISNAILCNNEWLKEPEFYDMLSMPILIAPVSTRPPVRGEVDSEVGGYGESIFAPNRDMDDLINDMASIWASHAKRLAEQPLINYRGDGGIEIKDTLHYAGGVINLIEGKNRIEPTPMKEISPTLVNLMNWLESKRSQGALPDIGLGSPPASGTALNIEQEASKRVFNPQLRNLNSFFSDICRLVEEQLIMGGVGKDKIKKVAVKIEHKRKYYEVKVTPVDLKKPHTIKVEFTARTPWTQLDVAQQAQMLKQLGLPDGWIWENILKIQDPKSLADLAAIELFEHSPKGAMKRAIEALMKTRGDVVAAQSLVRDLDRMEAEENMAAAPPPPEGEVNA